MPEIVMDSEFIVMAAGALISAGFTYVPKFNAWFAGLEKEVKQLTMLIAMLLVTATVFVLGCYDLVPINNFVCDKANAVQFIYLFILATFSNQSTDRVLPEPKAVKEAKHE